jgi:protein-disulfide isomerase
MALLAALAAEKQGAYAAFHRELMTLNGPMTPEAIEGAGKKLGLDLPKLKTDMNSKEVQSALMVNQRLASAIGVQSTPSFVIGGKLISGAMDLPGFEQLLLKRTNR